MPITLHRIFDGDVELFTHVAPDVFDKPIRPDRLRVYLADPNKLMILALDESLSGSAWVVGQCAGVLHRHPDKPTELYIDELGVASTHRRRGIGRALTREILVWGKEIGCESVWLATELNNKSARDLYDGVFDRSDQMVVYESNLLTSPTDS